MQLLQIIWVKDEIVFRVSHKLVVIPEDAGVVTALMLPVDVPDAVFEIVILFDWLFLVLS